jgi:hypothetical protein
MAIGSLMLLLGITMLVESRPRYGPLATPRVVFVRISMVGCFIQRLVTSSYLFTCMNLELSMLPDICISTMSK